MEQKGSPEKIMVSVLMFVYNHRPYLRRAIRSVVEQETTFPFEVIIHDDASTDGSQEIIREFAEKYPLVIVPVLQKENQMQQGISIVDKYVMPRVRGKYIAHCEGDDYWISRRKLKEQVDFLERHREYAGIACNCSVIDEKGKPGKPVRIFGPFKKPCAYTLQDLVLEDRMPGQTAAVLYRSRVQTGMTDAQRKAYQKIRYMVGDRRRTLLILLNGPVWCMGKTMSAYRHVTERGGSWNARMHGKNLSGRNYVQELDFRRFAREQYHIRLHNDFVLLGTGVMALLRFMKMPDAWNRRELETILAEYKTPAHFAIFLCSLLPRGSWTLIKRTVKRRISAV